MSVSSKLIFLSREIRRKESIDPMYGLGGQDGYGYDFENDTFFMKPFCWCEEKSCRWCSYNEANFIYKPTNAKVWWYKWIGRDTKTSGTLPSDWYERCFRSIWEHDPYQSWYEFKEKENGAIFVVLQFSVFDPKTKETVLLPSYLHAQRSFLCLEEIISLCETRKKQKRLEWLQNQYPMLEMKISKSVIDRCKREKKWIDEVIEKNQKILSKKPIVEA